MILGKATGDDMILWPFFRLFLIQSAMPCVACQRCNLGESDARQFSSTGACRRKMLA